MATTVVVRARVEQEVKDEAVAVLSHMGLTVSDVVRIVLTKIAKEGALPFDLNSAISNEKHKQQLQGKED
jgi:DNA-damage-inducible protein J